MEQYSSLALGLDGKRHVLSPVDAIFPEWRVCHERKLNMFWIFTIFAGLFGFAVTLGQLSVWFAILKMALMFSAVVIVLMGITLVFRKGRENSKT